MNFFDFLLALNVIVIAIGSIVAVAILCTVASSLDEREYRKDLKKRLDELVDRGTK